jgi:hypothetical protein
MVRVAQRLADDIVPFDQRGCLSPRLALVLGSADLAQSFAQRLAKALGRAQHDVPRGMLTPDEAADFTRYRDTMVYAAELIPAGKGGVGLDRVGRHLMLAPVGRNAHVARVDDAAVLGALAPSIAAVGVHGPRTLGQSLKAFLPRARLSEIGRMQRPAFDGPVDQRPAPTGELL